jgi:hypothetical protein
MGRKKKPRDWEELPHKKIEKKEVTAVAIYMTGCPNAACKHIEIRNPRRNSKGGNITTYFCKNPKMLRDSRMILTCTNCDSVEYK